MEAELSFIDLFLQASLLVKLVMLMLLAMSVWGWVLIFQRKKVIGQAHSDALKCAAGKLRLAVGRSGSSGWLR